MGEWTDIASKLGGNGFVGLVLLAIAYFFYTKVWPLFEAHLRAMESEIKEARQAHVEQGKEFTEALRRRDVLMAESNHKTVEALNALTHKLEGSRIRSE